MMEKTRLAVLCAFFVNGAVLASWLPHIPGVSKSLALPPSMLGLVLLGPSIGALLAMSVSGRACAACGNARVLFWSVLLYGLALPFTVLAREPLSLSLALVALGGGFGAMGVAMNAEAVRLERSLGRRLMSSFHAQYSLGSLIGVGAGGLSLSLGIAPWQHLFAASLAFGIIGVLSARSFSREREEAKQTIMVRPTRFLLLLGIGAFGSILVEGAVADWAAVHLHSLGATEGMAAMGYAAFSLAMLLARFCGDWMTHRLTPAGLVRSGGGLATLGLLLAMTGNPSLAILGFALIGLGLATVVPNFFSASGLDSSLNPASAVALVSTIGFMGRLVGPPVIGWIAQGFSMTAAWGFVATFSLLVALMAGALEIR